MPPGDRPGPGQARRASQHPCSAAGFRVINVDDVRATEWIRASFPYQVQAADGVGPRVCLALWWKSCFDLSPGRAAAKHIVNSNARSGARFWPNHRSVEHVTPYTSDPDARPGLRHFEEFRVHLHVLDVVTGSARMPRRAPPTPTSHRGLHRIPGSGEFGSPGRPRDHRSKVGIATQNKRDPNNQTILRLFLRRPPRTTCLG